MVETEFADSMVLYRAYFLLGLAIQVAGFTPSRPPDHYQKLQKLFSSGSSPDELTARAAILREEAASLEASVATLAAQQRISEVEGIFNELKREDGYIGANELKSFLCSLLRSDEMLSYSEDDLIQLTESTILRFDDPTNSDGLLSLEEFPIVDELAHVFRNEIRLLADERLRLEKEHLEEILKNNGDLYESLAEQSKGSNGFLGTGLTFNLLSAVAWNVGPALFGAFFVSRVIAQGILEGEESLSNLVDTLGSSGTSPF